MVSRKLFMEFSKFAMAVIIASSFNGVVYAKDGDVYNTTSKQLKYTKVQYTNDVTKLEQFINDMIFNTDNVGYEFNGNVLKGTDVTAKSTTTLDEFTTYLNVMDKDATIVKAPISDYGTVVELKGTFKKFLGLSYVESTISSEKTVSTVTVNGTTIAKERYSLIGTTLKIVDVSSTDVILITTTDGNVYTVKADTTVNTNLSVQSVSAINNGKIEVHFNNTLTANPNISDFTITQKIGNANITTVIPTGITMDSTMTIATLTLLKTIPKEIDQSVVYGISYKNSKVLSTTFIVEKSAPIIIGTIATKDINVANGTTRENIGLPKTVTVIMSDTTFTDANVTWDNGTPFYNGAIEGKYTFMGKVEGYESDTPISVNVAKAIEVMPTVKSVSLINITKNIGDAYTLPTTVTTTLSDGTIKDMPVTWEKKASTLIKGNYTFIGVLKMADGVVNSSNITVTASLTVVDKTTPIIEVPTDLTSEVFPLLSDVPQPIRSNYKEYSISKDRVDVFYCYDIYTSVNIDSYSKLLNNYGWKHYKTTCVDEFSPIFYTYVKGENSLTVVTDMFKTTIIGKIH